MSYVQYLLAVTLLYIIQSAYLLILDLSLKGHEIVVGLPEVVHVTGHAVVGGQLHLELGDHGRHLFQSGQSHFDYLEPVNVEGGHGPDPVPLVKHLVQLGLLLGGLLGDVVEQVLDLLDFRFVGLDLRLELLVADDQVLQVLHVAGEGSFADLHKWKKTI